MCVYVCIYSEEYTTEGRIGSNSYESWYIPRSAVGKLKKIKV